MRTQIKKTAILMTMLLGVCFMGVAQDAVVNAIKAGDASALSAHMDNSVEITILDKESTYSKQQAVMVLKNFFSNNKPSNFSIIHDGASGEGAKYKIGKLVTSNGTFRTYIYTKGVGGKALIQQLRFEEE